MARRREDDTDKGDHGELLGSAIMRSQAYSFTKFGTIGGRGAPLVTSYTHATVAPDGLMRRAAPLLAEFKVKGKTGKSEHGGPPGANWMRKGTKFHCIDRENVTVGYPAAQERFGMPVVILLICIQDAVLVSASLDELGEGYPSLQPRNWDVINFPLDRWTLLKKFHPRRLEMFFAEPFNSLTDDRMVKFVPWLTEVPQQGTFDFVEALTFENADNRWVRRQGRRRTT